MVANANFPLLPAEQALYRFQDRLGLGGEVAIVSGPPLPQNGTPEPTGAQNVSLLTQRF